MDNILRRIREAKSKTQGGFAKELGITQSALSQMEGKNKIPSMKTFLMLVQLGYINDKNMNDLLQEMITIQWGD